MQKLNFKQLFAIIVVCGTLIGTSTANTVFNSEFRDENTSKS